MVLSENVIFIGLDLGSTGSNQRRGWIGKLRLSHSPMLSPESYLLFSICLVFAKVTQQVNNKVKLRAQVFLSAEFKFRLLLNNLPHFQGIPQ